MSLVSVAFGGLGPLLAVGPVAAQRHQLVVVVARLGLGENRIQQPVDRQVGIAADGRGEMAVALAGQGVVAFFLGAVDRPLQRAEHGEVDGMLLGPSHGGGQQLLQLEAALQAVGLVAQFGHELLEQLDFRRAGRLVDAAEEVEPAVAERFGHGLVGGQHELLDDLVALGVFDHVGPRHAALLVQFHLDLGHGQFERTVGQPPLAEGHGQGVHAAQQAADLAAELALRRGIAGSARNSSTCS